MAASGAQIAEPGRVALDFGDAEQIELDASFMGDGRIVQGRVGAATGAGDDAGSVLKSFTGDDVTGADVLFDQPQNGLATGATTMIAAFVRCWLA